MKAALLNDSFPPVIDGVANVVMNYARIMTEKNLAEVLVATPRYPDARYDGYPYRVVPYKSYDTTNIVKGYRAGNPFAAEALVEMQEFKPDIIHTHCPVSSTVLARIIRNETGAPIIFTYHTKFDQDIAMAVKNKFLQSEGAKILAENISYCDEVWTVSHGAGENLRSLGYEGDYRVMSNGVDFAKGRVSEKEVREVMKEYDLKEGVPVYLFVGRIVRYKGLSIIVDAMKRLSDAGEDYRMIFVGNGVDAEEMKEKARKLGIAVDYRDAEGRMHTGGESTLPGRIIFAGAERDRNRLRAYNTAADLFLFPSTYDTNGIVVREAAACGLASVLIRGSCAAEGITDGRNGFVIEENGEAMARLLMKLSKTPEAMHQTGQNAMDEIYISWEDAVKEACERYGEIMEMKKKGELAVRKKEASDYFMDALARLTEGTEKVFAKPKREFKAEMQELKQNMQEFRDGMMENWNEAMDELHSWGENVSGQLQEKKENMKGQLQEKRENMKGQLQEKKEEWKEGVSQVVHKKEET
ncbi:MAG: glycosyltransferase [Lachnospiraceae bacterium]|nr:glycosyltransferase [Lachnospiraceae bacterium]